MGLTTSYEELCEGKNGPNDMFQADDNERRAFKVMQLLHTRDRFSTVCNCLSPDSKEDLFDDIVEAIKLF